jgi:hypothetical protein
MSLEKVTFNMASFVVSEFLIKERDHWGAERELFRNYYIKEFERD